MKLDFGDVEKRMNDFVSYFSKSLFHLDINFCSSQSNCQNFVPEEKLFYIFLVTHFDSSHTAKDFYRKLNWKRLQKSNKNRIIKICDGFFSKKRLIGNHRRHFRCMKKKNRIKYTVKILESYKEIVRNYGSQVKFFEINKNPEFDVLYQRMTEIAHFHTRLPRFDHLERVSRAHNFYVAPKRFYSEDATGPLDGLTYLFFGKRYRKDKQTFSRYFIGNFPLEWNSKVDKKYRIHQRVNFKEVIERLEQWMIFHVKELLSQNKRNDAFVFDLESCLCNWQKRK